ncbi:MAG TPA: DUF998 domain-containing protein [Fimbriimonadaceae bacterium]|nr:DUF998 domain-containing protein [Fimbriimonadaceae bacterium]
MDAEARWRRLAKVAALAVILILVAEHFLPHGVDLNPVDHWLSEYALSRLAFARWLIRVAFAALATVAVVVAQSAKSRLSRWAFLTSAAGLASMILFDTDPNDGRPIRFLWPPTAGNLHQIALYVAIGGALSGMVLAWRNASALQRLCLSVSAVATAVQVCLVAVSQACHEMTHFGGITERLVVLAMLAWAILEFGVYNGSCEEPHTFSPPRWSWPGAIRQRRRMGPLR